MKNNNIFNKLIYFIISLFLSISINLKIQINYGNAFPDFFINKFHFDIFFYIKVILIAFICYFILQMIFKLIDKIEPKKMIVPYSSKIICSISFIGIFISSLIFLLTHYPGVTINDTLNIIKDPITFSSNNSIISNLLLSKTYNLLFKLFNNMNSTFFFISIIKIIITDIIITLIINWYHQTLKNKTTTILLLIFFITTPIIANYNTAIISNSVLATILLLHIPLIYHLIISEGESLKNIKYIIYMTTTFILTILFGINGIYIVLFMFMIIFIKYLKYWKQLGIIFLITIVLSQIPILLLPKQQTEFQQKINIPLQQIFYVITHDNQNISSSDSTYINKIMNKKEIKKNYNLYSVETIKSNKNFNAKYINNTKDKFRKTWLNIMSNHFESYTKSYILTTYELWSIEKFNPSQSRFLEINKDNFNNDFKNLKNKEILPNSIQNTLKSFYKNLTIFFNNGTCFWILIILSLFALYKEKKELIILSLPLIILWIISMTSTSASFALKDMCSYLYLLPFIIPITIIYCKNKTE